MKKIIGFIFVLAIFLYSCSEKQDALDVGTHPEGWNNPQSEIFHAKTVVEAGSENCQDCHGTDYLGGTSGVSCYQCHGSFPHPVGFADINSPGFHGEFIKVSPVLWDIRSCQSCHGEDYSGGAYAPSCTTCHSAEDGPEACNTCHGSSTNIAPPQDLSNNTVNTAIGVGAHQTHVATTAITRVYSCTMCHTEVSEFDDPDHIDGIVHAEVLFGELATDSGELSTDWNRTTASCSQVYCHGSFALGSDGDITGKSDAVVWTQVNPDPAACNFCHTLPPAGHDGQGVFTTPGSCAQCHGSVVNSNGVIINKFLHINGEGNF
jgi:predicted CxxxxCH...CXXCH cytochrome family protein